MNLGNRVAQLQQSFLVLCHSLILGLAALALAQYRLILSLLRRSFPSVPGLAGG